MLAARSIPLLRPTRLPIRPLACSHFCTKKTPNTIKNLAPQVPEILKNIIPRSRGFVRALLRGKKTLTLTENNETKLYFNGSQAFLSIWDAIQKAQKKVWVETYILDPDPVGLRTIEELLAARKRGCEVVLIYDHIGSFSLGVQHIQPLIDAGALVVTFHPLVGAFKMPWDWRWPLFRTHRKIVVADDIAFCGSMNIGADYAGPDLGGNGRFRDTHAKIVGPAVVLLEQIFLNSLQNASVPVWEKISPSFDPTRKVEGHGDSPIVVLESDVRRRKIEIQDIIQGKIKSAKESVQLTSPYFLPTPPLTRSIIHAAKRGIQVELITHGLCTTPLISHATNHILGHFLKNGVKVYQLQTQELHAKTVVVDNMASLIGTLNYDHLSYKHLLEVAFITSGAHEAKELSAQFEVDKANSKEITLADWERRTLWQKIVQFSAYVCATTVFR